MLAVYSDKSVRGIEEEFSWLKDECYLDFAGAGLYSSRQLKNSYDDLSCTLYGNPHSLNNASRYTSDIIDRIRYRILQLFNTDPEKYSVIFTSGATQAIKLVIDNFVWNEGEGEDTNGEDFYDAVSSRGTFAYTSINHTSIVGGRILASSRGADVICVPEEVVELQINRRNLSKFKQNTGRNSLFAYPAQCNFSGKKYPLSWIEAVHNGALNKLLSEPSSWFCLLDAATFCSTNYLNLSTVSPDFVCISFYKLFGYPSGLGALLVRNDVSGCLRKSYFGGGTVDVSVPSGRFYKLRSSLSEGFEDGTLPFLSIISLGHALDTFSRLGLTFKEISLHTFLLAKYLVEGLRALEHWNGYRLVEIYSDSSYDNVSTQGGIVAFNLKRSDGTYIGFVEVLHIANLNNIHLRTGCFCNVGACQKYLCITDDDLVTHFQAGHVCGDERDLVHGKPTGAIRVSFGYPSSIKDVQRLLKMLKNSFLESNPQTRGTSQFTDATVPSLKSIRLYPVKSCGPMEVTSWRLTNRGLDFDRQWMVVTSNGVCLTQKQEPQLCRIIPVVDPATESVTLTFSGEHPIVISSPSEDNGKFNLCTNKVCGDRVEGRDCGDEVATWLSEHLKREGLRLIRQCPEDTRISKVQALRGVKEDVVGQLSLANQAQYLLINENSVNWLRKRIPDEPDFNNETLLDRFRANLIVTGIKEFDELEWCRVQVGKVQLKIEGFCTRCQMICIDQQTGEKNRKPLVELSRALDGKLRFGMYCSHVAITEESIISVGDSITVEKS